MTMYKALHPGDFLSQEEREEEDLPALKTALDTSIRLEDSKEKHEGRLIAAIKNNTDNTRNNRPTMTKKQKREEKQLNGRFKWLTSDNSQKKTWTWLRKGNLKIETERLLITAQNNAVRTKHIKVRIDKTQKNSRCRLWGDRDETINHLISKFAQKEYMTKHDLVGHVIHWELCKKLKFGHTNKWYMHNPESVRENERHKILGNFEIQTDPLILARWPGLIIINKKREPAE